MSQIAIHFSFVSTAQVPARDRLPSRTDTLAISGSGPFLLRPFLVSGSVSAWLDGDRLSENSIRVDERNGFLFILDERPVETAQLIVTYRYIPISLTGVLRRWPIRTVEDPERGNADIRRRGSAVQFDQFSTDQQVLRRSGSITRGITTGSARDVAIESGLRLQLDGQLVEGLDISAVLTDENTPILPEGTTQRLNDFDRVFIQLTTSFGQVQLGDVDGRIEGGLFGQFRRKLQGVSATTSLTGTESSIFRNGSLAVAGATSRGKFRTQSINIVDGVQGPYRLEGADGERFIILLPGSEVVYMDGIQMQRGASSDYVVDYATGEITFSPRRIMTADRRVSVEFQYTTQQFTRTLVAADVETAFGRLGNGASILTLGATAIRESDGDQFSEEFGISSADSIAISLAGDSDAFNSGATAVVFDPEALFTQYVIRTSINSLGEQVSFFSVVSEMPPDSVQVYRVTFSRVGEGSGSYRRTGLVTNGIAFEYVGSGNGAYEPIRPLPKPYRQQLFDARTTIRPHSLIRISGEWAASALDLNRLSNLDSGDDLGTAYQLGLFLEPLRVTWFTESDVRLSGSYQRQFRDADFATFERVRPVEYERQWNLQNVPFNPTGGIREYGNESMEEVRAGISWSDSSAIGFSAARVELGDVFSGRRSDGQLRMSNKVLPDVDYRVEHISSDDLFSGQSGEWIRHLGKISYASFGGSLRSYMELEYENLEQLDTEADSLVSPSNRFLESRIGTSWLRERQSFGIDLERRTEKRVVSGERLPFESYTVSTNISVSPSSSLHSEALIGYRVSEESGKSAVPAESSGTTSKNASNDSFVLQVNGRWSPGETGSSLSWLYQAQTERSAALQEIYIRTGQERGEYVWVDENEDGVIQLEEFLPETTQDEGLYVRTYLPGDSLESVSSVRGRFRLELQPPRSSGVDKGGIYKLLSGLNSVTIIDFEEKSRDPNRSNLYLLRLSTFQSPDQTLSGRIRLRQEIGLFRNNRALDIQLTGQTTQSLTELAAGEEKRSASLGRINIRYSMGQHWTGRMQFDRHQDLLTSESFNSRNYDILASIWSPSISWTVTQPLRLTISSTFSRKKDRISQGTATIVRVPFDARYRIGSRVDISSRFEVSSVTVSQTFRGRVAFEMTDGRGPGTSYLWRIAIQSNLSDVLTATASYDGRSPENRPVIHTARFQLSARF